MSLNHLFGVIVGVLALATVTWGQECNLPGDNGNQMKGSCVPKDECRTWKGLLARPSISAQVLQKYIQANEACKSQGTNVCCATEDIIKCKKDIAPECLQDRLGEDNKHNGTYPSDSTFIAFISYYNETANQTKLCGGSMITSEFVLTAAHCVKGVKRHLVYIGTSNINLFYPEFNESYPDGIEYIVTESVIHNLYNAKTYEYDIALLRLPEAVNFSLPNSPQPVCIPMAGQHYSVLPKRSSRVLKSFGWGSNIEGILTESKQLVTVQEISLELCREELNGTAEKIRNDGEQICTITISGHNVFPGFSGCPLMYRQNEVWFMVGLVSHGYTYKNRNSNKYPYINTFIGNHTAKWIVENINRMKLDYRR
ncbi:CLIP domain-containing serine protease 14D-like [Anopheles aquasalis]|uniref:CLIP domain-containing serine protease 14D-like n=1 Tax=Anopheles aquasalis TaxID=42839 RepID=UPI00215B40AB|nr:CLIP domain-containing serine protease 14D-like [Anopheles aquasalis]